MPCFLVPVRIRTVRIRCARTTDAPPATNPVPDKVSHHINGPEPGIVRQARQKPCYRRPWECRVECSACGLPGDDTWVRHFCKRPRLHCVPNEIEAESD